MRYYPVTIWCRIFIMLVYNSSLQSFWRRQWQPTPVLLPGKSHGRRSLEGCSPWGRWGSDTTEQLHFHFSLSFIGEGNGNPLQCSCLENPRDGGAWWAAIYGVAQSQTRLKRRSSSSSSRDFPGSPVVKTSPSSAGCVGLIPSQEAKIPHASQPKIQTIKQK